MVPSSPSTMSTLRLSDGRAFEYLDNGISSDKAILFLHGTPGDATAWSTWLNEITTVTAIATSRPGYGLSERKGGRTVAHDLQNQAQVLDHLGIKSFVAIGWSGGGPHSLNMTRDSRCVASFTLAGVGESGREDLNFLEGMGPENHDEFGEALRGEAAITAWMEKNAPSFQTVTGEQIIEAFGGLIGDADKRALTPRVADQHAATLRRALRNGFTGWIDDDLAFVRDFGFDLHRIQKPVVIWQGDDDYMVPKAHSEWLAKHIPGSQLRFVPGHGHISLGEEFRPTIIADALTYLE
ncbi:MAG: alpha/beta hydrolase [Actinobacteria bacterium]|nr:alpha/beta hydrolase [Actinomycetota bacterium]